MNKHTLPLCRVSAFAWLIRSKLSLLLLTLILTTAYSQGNTTPLPQTVHLSMHLINAPLEKAFALIKQQSAYRVIYDNSILKSAKPVTIFADKRSLFDVLRLLFQDQPFDYRIMNETIIVMPRSSKPVIRARETDKTGPVATDTLITGIIVADSGSFALAGATISIRGTNRFTTTNNAGQFWLSIPNTRVTLVISYIGYASQNIIVDRNSKSPIRIQLKKAPQEMEEVKIINTGYQDIPKERIPGSFVLIDNKTLNEQTGTNILQRLNNVTSGLLFNIGKVNTNPQNTTNISIRGLSTINGPLDPLIVVDNFIYEGDINNINPNDVENITVLKDAAATSIWGARAGNGVIVITTKKGKFNQHLKIDFNTDVIVTQKPDLYYPSQISSADEINVEELIFNKGYFDDQINDIYQRPALTPAVQIFLNRRNGLISSSDSASQINALKSIDSRSQYDKYFYQTAVTQQYALNLRGGGNNIAWLASGSYDKNIYNLKNEDDKVNLRFNNTYKPAKNLQIDAGVYYTSSKTVSGLSTGFTLNGRRVPYLQFADNKGNPLPIAKYNSNYTDTAGAGNLLNWNFYPLDDYKHDKTTTSLQEIVANIGINYQIFPNLRLNANYQYQKQSSSTERLADLQSFYTRDLINNFSQVDYADNIVNYIIPKGGILNESTSNTSSQNFRGQLNFDKNWDNHAVSAIAGTEIREVIDNGYSSGYYGYNRDPLSFGAVDYTNYYPTFISGYYQQVPNAPAILPVLDNRFVSFFGNASYTYRQRYNIYGSMRKDAANVFGLSTNDKWNPLWSAGVGWDISKENAYHIKALPYLKIRTSYGYSGNLDVNQTPLPISTSGLTDLVTNFPILSFNNPNNPSLRWEKSGQLNIGIDFAIISRILSGSIDYYRKKGSDLYGITAFDYTAFPRTNQVTKNVADMQGNGMDIMLKSNNFDKIFKWTTSLLFNYNHNKTTAYYTAEAQSTYTLLTAGQNITPVIGYPLYAIAAYKWGGLNGSGDPQGYLQGKKSTDYNSIATEAGSDGLATGSIVYAGPSSPTCFGSLINEFSWKGFSASFNISYSLGYFFRKTSFTSNTLINDGVAPSEYTKRWQHPGDELKTNVPAFVYTDYPQFSQRDLFYTYADINVLRADNIRLQYVNLGYSISKKIWNLPIEHLQLYLNAANPGILWRANKEHLDPDYPSSFPASKSYTLGLRANF